MKFSLFKRKLKKQEDRVPIKRRLNVIKTGEKTEKVTDNVPSLVKGLSDGDG